MHIIDSINYFFDKKLEILKLKILKSQNTNDLTLDLDIMLAGYKAIIYIPLMKDFSNFELDLKFERGRIQILDFGRK